MDAISLRRMNEGQKRPIRRLQESKLDKKSLEMLEECEIDNSLDGVGVIFKPLSFSLNETEAKALIEFGRDNNLYLDHINIDIWKNYYHATAFYPSDNYGKGFEEIDEEENGSE
jgi:hypothetical protein